MKVKLFLFLVLGIFCLPLQAQVTIGGKEKAEEGALLDIKENANGTSTKGLLLPRVALVSIDLPNPLPNHIAGMTLYNTSSINNVQPGYYYNDGSKWLRLFAEVNSLMPSFFYMPSIVLPTDAADPAYDKAMQQFTIDLYLQYSTQFGLANSASSTSSTGMAELPIPSVENLEYYITYYDPSVFTAVQVTEMGKLTYKLHPQISISEKTFMNIVFKMKQAL